MTKLNIYNPLVSVVTIVLDGEDNLEETILSIINQTYKNIEYIVIDGGSKDDSINIIKKFEDKIAYWISEPDRGHYYAYNKGIDSCSGDYVNFMNCGDKFCKNDVIENIFNKVNSECIDADIIYGDIIKEDVDSGLSYIYKNHPLNKLSERMVFGFQSVFIKRSVINKYKFNVKYKISADYNLLATCYLNNYKFYYSNILTGVYRSGGISQKRTLRIILEDFSIQRRFSPNPYMYSNLFRRIYSHYHYKIFKLLDMFVAGRKLHSLLRSVNSRIKIQKVFGL